MKLTTEMVVDALPLDRQRFNRERMIWEASVGAGFSTDLDALIIRARLLEMSAACLACAEYIAKNHKITNQTDEEIRLQ